METPGHSDLTVHEVAELIGTHPETIRRWLRRGFFQNAYQISKRYGWRIPIGDVEALRHRKRKGGHGNGD